MRNKFSDILLLIGRNLYNIPGWRTNRRIIVLESDDWGSIRMPDMSTYNKLLSKGVRVDNCPYNKYDSLESEDDLSALFEVLGSFADKFGNHPVLTANCVVANPDFERIEKSDFQEYHYELFTETLRKYPKHINSFRLWREGMDKKLFYPQFHGREHLNVGRWMRALKFNLPETRLAFDLNLFGLSTTITSEKRRSYLEAFAVDNNKEIEQIRVILNDGLSIFKQIFGYSSKSFIAPNYVWPSEINKDLLNMGVKYLKGIRTQLVSNPGEAKKRKLSHYTGKTNELQQIYLVRNCEFEPCFSINEDSSDNCLVQINRAFRWGKPAIISTHRVNFIGSLVPLNRDRNIKQFRYLLTEVFKRWPNVEFLTSTQLGDLIYNEKNNK